MTATTAAATRLYIVTDKAGRRVAGRFVHHGQALELTPGEAEYHLAAGELREKDAAPPPGPGLEPAPAKTPPPRPEAKAAPKGA